MDETEAVSRALASSSSRPVVIADMWDNPGGGTAGDATVILEELLARGVENVAIGLLWDPIAVQICMAAGEGAEIPLRFGAKSAPGTGQPIDGTVKVVKLQRDAEMRFGDSIAPFGDAAHIHYRGIDIVLGSVRVQSYDPSLFTALGIDPTTRRILVIKSTNHFYAPSRRSRARSSIVPPERPIRTIRRPRPTGGPGATSGRSRPIRMAARPPEMTTITARIGDPILSLSTPLPVIDEDRLAANIRRVQDYMGAHGLAFRPHIKTHKIPALAHEQVAAGATGINCQKITEAEVFADAGFDDILITFNILGSEKLARLAALNARISGLKVVADSQVTVAGLAAHVGRRSR